MSAVDENDIAASGCIPLKPACNIRCMGGGADHKANMDAMDLKQLKITVIVMYGIQDTLISCVLLSSLLGMLLLTKGFCCKRR